MMLRVEKLESKNGVRDISLYKDILDVFVFDAAALMRKAAQDVLYSAETSGETEKFLKAVDYFTTTDGVNTRDARRRVADKLIEDNTYKF